MAAASAGLGAAAGCCCWMTACTLTRSEPVLTVCRPCLLRHEGTDASKRLKMASESR